MAQPYIDPQKRYGIPMNDLNSVIQQLLGFKNNLDPNVPENTQKIAQIDTKLGSLGEQRTALEQEAKQYYESARGIAKKNIESIDKQTEQMLLGNVMKTAPEIGYLRGETTKRGDSLAESQKAIAGAEGQAEAERLNILSKQDETKQAAYGTQAQLDLKLGEMAQSQANLLRELELKYPGLKLGGGGGGGGGGRGGKKSGESLADYVKRTEEEAKKKSETSKDTGEKESDYSPTGGIIGSIISGAGRIRNKNPWVRVPLRGLGGALGATAVYQDIQDLREGRGSLRGTALDVGLLGLNFVPGIGRATKGGIQGLKFFKGLKGAASIVK